MNFPRDPRGLFLPRPSFERRTWSTARVAEAAALYRDHTAVDLAERFGTTKNAIIGAMHRNGVRKREADDAPRPPHPLDVDRNPKGCRWPLWANGERPDHHYCAGAVVVIVRADKSVSNQYCAEHRKVAYRSEGPT